ncbi:MAG: zonular occludens toxin domain-containing protein [Thermoplasmata archaeon]
MKVKTNKTPIEDLLRKYLNPQFGKGVFMAGGKGRGKTHEVVNYIYHLSQDLGWHVCCNIQFASDSDRDMPPKVHFVKRWTDFWKTFADIRENREKYGPVPVVLVIDEFHTTVNRLESHKYWNIVTAMISYLSQIRKFTQSALFATQYLIQIPKDPRKYADHFVVKNKKVAKQMRLNSRKMGEDDVHTRYFSQVLDLEDGEVKVLDRHGNVDYKKAEKFRKRHISEDVEDLIKHDIVSNFLASLSCPWNDPHRGKWQFKSDGVSTLEFDEINRDEVLWFSKLMSDLGEAKRKGKKTHKAIRDFFENYEGTSDDKYSLEDFSKSELAQFIYSIFPGLTLRETGEGFNISGEAVRKTEVTEEKEYWLRKNFLQEDIEEAVDMVQGSQNQYNQPTTAPPHIK